MWRLGLDAPAHLIIPHQALPSLLFQASSGTFPSTTYLGMATVPRLGFREMACRHVMCLACCCSHFWHDIPTYVMTASSMVICGLDQGQTCAGREEQDGWDSLLAGMA